VNARGEVVTRPADERGTAGQEVVIREGAVRELERLLAELGAARVFLVYDEPAYRHSGAAEALDACLSRYRAEGFSEFQLNPKIEDAVRGIERFRAHGADVVVALGGGSALDMAKLIAVCGVQPGAPLEYATGRRVLERAGPPVIAIPTTSGTGSEATHFAVVYVGGEKYSLAHPSLRPAHVLIDPALTHSLPAAVTAASGLDALSQATESLWASGATEESAGYAAEALTLSFAHLENAVNRPTPEDRLAMARAAHLAGKAIDISKTTAPHAVSYAITTRFGVPHGAAVALTLGAFLGYNNRVDEASCNDPRGPAAVRERIGRIATILGGGSVPRAQERLRALVQNVGCAVRLREVGIEREHLPVLARTVNLERLSNNPRKIETAGLVALLESVF
jgi:alcohol dehydrogenase